MKGDLEGRNSYTYFWEKKTLDRFNIGWSLLNCSRFDPSLAGFRLYAPWRAGIEVKYLRCYVNCWPYINIYNKMNKNTSQMIDFSTEINLHKWGEFLKTYLSLPCLPFLTNWGLPIFYFFMGTFGIYKQIYCMLDIQEQTSSYTFANWNSSTIHSPAGAGFHFLFHTRKWTHKYCHGKQYFHSSLSS